MMPFAKYITLVVLLLPTSFFGNAQTFEQFKPRKGADNDLVTAKNILQLKSGGNARFELEKTMYYSRSDGALGKWVVSYEKSLAQGSSRKNWWGFKTDTRLSEIYQGNMESRLLVMHKRDINDYIKMKTNWGFVYGSGLIPTYMMGLTFDLTRQWYLSPPRIFPRKSNDGAKRKNEE